AGLASYVPMPALAGVLVVVAWNMSEHGHFRHTLRSAPMADRLVLVLTFLLTVFVDLTVAIEAGMVVAAFSFMHRMAQMVEVSAGVQLIQDDDALPDGPEARRTDQREHLPPGVEVFQISGPLFFGAASRLDNLIDQFHARPRVFILRMRLVPFIDASGVHALRGLAERCERLGIALVLSGLQAQPLSVAHRMGLHEQAGKLQFAPDFDAALALANSLLPASHEAGLAPPP
ncbi:MAG: STAS domain-containing protein, partial [Arenimonas sp.]|nr:STAS domain-containing protein [Arenimonas sp.]